MLPNPVKLAQEGNYTLYHPGKLRDFLTFITDYQYDMTAKEIIQTLKPTKYDPHKAVFSYIHRLNLPKGAEGYGVQKHISLHQVVQLIQDDERDEVTSLIRECVQNYLSYEDPKFMKEKRQYKENGLPSVIFSAVLPIRSGYAESEAQAHTGYIVIDIDEVKNPDKVYDALAQDPTRKLLFLSPSGSPKCVIPVNKASIECHKYIYDQVAESINNILRVEGLKNGIDYILDTSGSNLTRHTFIPYSPEAEILGTTIFKVDTKAIQHRLEQEAEAHKAAKKIASGKIEGREGMLTEHIIGYLESNSLSITETYENWIKVGFALSDTFEYDTALDYFHKFSELDSNYEPADCNKKFNNLFESAQKTGLAKKTGFGSIMYLAREKGWERPVVVVKEGGEIAEGNDDSVENIYITKKGRKLKAFEDVVLSKHRIWRNEITSRIMLNGEQLLDRHLAEFYHQAHTLHGIDITKEDIYVCIERCETINPVKVYIEVLSERHKENPPTGYIRKMADSLEVEGFTKQEVSEFFEKWLIGIWGNVYNEIPNILALILTGQQHAGKSHFFKYLLPEPLREYFCKSTLDKDHEQIMCSYLLVMDDEYDGKNKKETALWKEIQSTAYFTFRAPYAKMPETRKRLATLCGTANEDDLLTDHTGNRRNIVFKLKGRDKDIYDSIPKDMLLLEAYNKYKAGVPYELDMQQIKVLNAKTEDFREMTVEEQLVRKYCCKKSLEETISSDNMYLTAEIINFLQHETTFKRLSPKRIGQALQKLGYQKKSYKRNSNSSKVRYWIIEPLLMS